MTNDNEPLRAVALKYDGENAPTVTASGEGNIARRNYSNRARTWRSFEGRCHACRFIG